MRVLGIGVGIATAVTVASTVVAVTGEIVARSEAGDPWTTTVPAVALSAAAAAWFAVGAFLVSRRPHHALGWLFLGAGAGTQVGVAGDAAARAGWGAWSGTTIGTAVDTVVGLGLFALIGLLPLLYPSGRLTGAGERVLAVVTLLGALGMQAQWWWAQLDPARTWPFGPPPGPEQSAAELWGPFALYAVGVLGGWLLAVVRLSRASTPERQQRATLLVAVVALATTMLLGDSAFAMTLQALALLGLPVSIGVGVLRYRLWDIEAALPRAVAGVLLAGVVAAGYVLATTLAGTALTDGEVPLVLTTALLALALMPLRERLARIVDRALYGRRGDPVGAVADLGSALAAAADDALVDAALTRVAAAFRSPGARVRDTSGAVVAAVGDLSVPAALSTEVLVAGATTGTLELPPRRSGGRYSRADTAMLRAMAGPISLAMRSLSLAEDLAVQRDAVVDASTRARDRLSRDLHDGLGPSLTGLRLGLDALVDALDAEDVGRAGTLAAVLRAESVRSVTEVRRVIDDLRPPDLDDAGLVEALRRRFSADLTTATCDVRVRAHDLPELPAAIEVSVFRIVGEAVANARRHANARTVVVNLRGDDGLLLVSVLDDGAGFPPDATPGVGLASMRARAAEHDGELDVTSSADGTVVSLRVPIPQGSLRGTEVVA